MGKAELLNVKKTYKSNKLQMVKSKKGKIIGLELSEKIKNIDSNTDITFDIEFNPNIPIQKIVMNQGILLPYKFSKRMEKSKLVLYFMYQNTDMDKDFLKKQFLILNEFIKMEIHKILHREVGGFWSVNNDILN